MPPLNEEQIREIIRDEMSNFDTIERYTFQKKAQFFDGRNIQVGKSNGTKIATETTQKLGFFGVTPVDQPNAVSDPAGQADDLDSEARTAINAIIDVLQELGLMA